MRTLMLLLALWAAYLHTTPAALLQRQCQGRVANPLCTQPAPTPVPPG